MAEGRKGTVMRKIGRVGGFAYVASFMTIFWSSSGLANADQVWADLLPGEWYEVPASALTRYKPDPEPPGLGGYGGLTGAWNGGAFDVARDLFIIWGGGHSDYSGNEIYAFDVNTLSWSRLTEPTPASEIDVPIQDPDKCVYLDGRPRSLHSYDSLEVIPGLGFCIGGKGAYPDGAVCNKQFWCNDFSKQSNAMAGWYRPPGLNILGPFNYQSVNYDSLTNVLYQSGKNQGGWQRLYALDLNADVPAWKILSKAGNAPASVGDVAAIDRVNQILLVVGKKGQLYWDLTASGVWSPTSNYDSITGPRIVADARAPGLEWDEVNQKFIAWVGGTSTYAYDFLTNSWRVCSQSPLNITSPSAPESNGTYGRFQYVPSKNAYVLYNQVEANVFLYRLSAECQASTDELAPAAPTDFMVK